MALEAEVVLVGVKIVVFVLVEVDFDDTDAALNRSNRIPSAAGEAADGARRLPERAVNQMHRVPIVISRLIQVPDVNLLV